MRYRPSKLRWLIICVAALACSNALARTPSHKEVGQGRFEHIGAAFRLHQIIEAAEKASTPQVVGAERWREQIDAWRVTLEAAVTHEQFADAVNNWFASLGVSHLRYFMDDEWNYWYVLSTFSEEGESDRVEHIGVVPQRIGGRWFVRGVLQESPAAHSNVRVGDELVAVDGAPYEPIASFRGRAGTDTVVTLRRRPDLVIHLPIRPIKEALNEAACRAQRESVHVFTARRYQIAYVHCWSLLCDGEEFGALLGLQHEVDGLIVDFRDGFGGTPLPATQFLLGANGQSANDGLHVWHKPAVILIADGTRSAKEMVVDAVKKAGRAPLVGTPTPGHVTTVGAVRQVGQDGLLMLPGMRLELEGKPTQPDYLVPRDIRYCAGADPQLDVGKMILVKLIAELTPRQSVR